MGASQFATFVVFVGLVGLAGYLTVVVVPTLAHNRMVAELSKVRSALRDMIEDEPMTADHPDVQRVDELLASTLRTGHAPGMSVLAVALLTVWRNERAGDPEPPPTFRGLSSPQRLALYLLAHRAALELIRASILGSRLWFLAWPAWLYIAARLRRGETLRRDSRDDHQLGQVLFIGSSGFDTPTLQGV